LTRVRFNDDALDEPLDVIPCRAAGSKHSDSPMAVEALREQPDLATVKAAGG
jgi:hypothetical protein